MLPARAQIRQARQVLRKGGVIAYPTESCFGLGCDPKNRRALRAILRLKSRPNYKGMIILSADWARAKRLFSPLSPADEARLLAMTPAFLSVLLPAKSLILKELRGQHSTLALRIPEAIFLHQLLKQLGILVSTSANKAGQKSLKRARDCQKIFPEVFVLKGKIGKARRPSTLIEFSTGRVLRA